MLCRVLKLYALMSVVAPVYAEDNYGSAASFGAMLGAFGAGALVGTLVFSVGVLALATLAVIVWLSVQIVGFFSDEPSKGGGPTVVINQPGSNGQSAPPPTPRPVASTARPPAPPRPGPAPGPAGPVLARARGRAHARPVRRRSGPSRSTDRECLPARWYGSRTEC